MNFISYTNTIKLEAIDLKTNLIGIVFEDKYIVYSWIGGCSFSMDYSPDLGNYVDSWNNIQLTFCPEHSDDNIDDNTLSVLEYNREYIIEHIVQQVYINEMKNK